MTTIYYTIEPGDTIWGIAQYFGTTVDELLRYNNIQDMNRIHPGQQIHIPTKMMTAPKWYAVRPGDTLYTISLRYGLDINDIIDNNNLVNPNTIYPGQLIMLHNQ
ncbi:MAG: LysM peptidoglycan-binding domain-containing protein [Acutalibacteraceae bacterium]|nr:LysM peptidoglycan-binding domain-containing protein [Acutalibacteraceae bacterium]